MLEQLPVLIDVQKKNENTDQNIPLILEMDLPAKNHSKVAFCILTHLYILSSDLIVMVMFAYFLGYVLAILIGKQMMTKVS